MFDRNPVTDSTRAFDLLNTRGATISALGGPIPETGGHKGFGLSLVMQILSAALSNAASPGRSGDQDNIGHFLLAIDPAAVNPGGRTQENVEALLNQIQEDAPSVVLPGQPRRAIPG